MTIMLPADAAADAALVSEGAVIPERNRCV